MEYEYECGTFKNGSGEEVDFVRVVSVEEVITRMVTELYDVGFLEYVQNLPDDALWLHFSADKGGKSTKLILQIINMNGNGRHSIRHCKILGFYEGKDSQENIEGIFGPIIASLQRVADNIASLKLKRPAYMYDEKPTQRKPAPGKLLFVYKVALILYR